jgi:hypothetical protein
MGAGVGAGRFVGNGCSMNARFRVPAFVGPDIGGPGGSPMSGFA